MGHDPIKRAELIKDLVETIAKIPDSIKRSVFYQEVANLMGIEESILITEGNKISLKKVADAEKDRNRQSRNQQVGELGVLVEQKSDNQALIAEKNDISRSAISYQEEETVRLLVCYGGVVIEHIAVENRDITLADYVFDQIKENSTPKSSTGAGSPVEPPITSLEFSKECLLNLEKDSFSMIIAFFLILIIFFPNS